MELVHADRWHIRIRFLEPYRIDPADYRAPKDESPKSFSMWRERTDINWGSYDGLFRPYMRGRLIRSLVFREIETLLALQLQVRERRPCARLFREIPCCPGNFEPYNERKGGVFLRRKAGFDLRANTDEPPRPCADRASACALCLFLGSLDDIRGNRARSPKTVHWGNLYVPSNVGFQSVDEVAVERPSNRVDQYTSTARDHRMVFEADERLCGELSGWISFNDSGLEQRENLRLLLAAALAKINRAAGAACRIDIVDKNGAPDVHRELLEAFFATEGAGSETMGRAVERYGEDSIGAASFDAGHGVARPGGDPLPATAEIRGNAMGEASRAILDTLKNTARSAYAIPIADSVLCFRARTDTVLDLLPMKTGAGENSIWTDHPRDGQSILEIIRFCWSRCRERGMDWGDFCEKLGTEIIRRVDENPAEPRESRPTRQRIDERPKKARTISPSGRIRAAHVSSLPTRLWLVRGQLRAETPFHFGTGHGQGQVSLPIVRDRMGQFIIPRTELTGALRRTLKELLDGRGCDAELELPHLCDCEICQVKGGVLLTSARSPVGVPQLRYSNRIIPATRTVGDGGLFNLEVGPQGLLFPFTMLVATKEERMPHLLASVLRLWMDGGLFLGGREGSGKGRFSLVGTHWTGDDWVHSAKGRYFNLTRQQDLRSVLLNRSFVDGTREAGEGMEIDLPLPAPDEVSHPWERIDYTLSIDSPLLSRDPVAALSRDDLEDGRALDAVMTRKIRYVPDGNGGIRDEEIDFLKGEGLRGLLGYLFGKNADCHDRIHVECSCDFCKVLGSKYSKGMITVEDAELANGTVVTRDLFDHLAIDRLTAGAQKRKKFDDVPLLGRPGNELCLSGKLWLKKGLVRGQDEETKRLRGLLAKALSDLRDGIMPVGGKAAIGYGHVAGLHLQDPHKILPLRAAPAQPQINRAKLRFEGFKPPEISASSVYHPYYYVEPGAKGGRQGFGKNPGYVSHDRYHNERYTGKLVCTLDTLGPLFIPGSHTTTDETTGHRSESFLRVLDKLAIPGSGIRGPVSSVFEALTNSCYRVVDEGRHLSWRMPADLQGILGEYKPGMVTNGGKEIAMFGKTARVPVYDGSHDLARDFTPDQIAGRAPANLHFKEFQWRVSFVDRSTENKWKGIFQNGQATVITGPTGGRVLDLLVHATIEGTQGRRQIRHFMDDKDMEVFTKHLTAAQQSGQAPIACWVRKSRYHKAFLRIPPHDPDGWVATSGYIHITGPCGLNSSRTPIKGMERFRQTLPKAPARASDWINVRTNAFQAAGGRKPVFYCQDRTTGYYYAMTKHCETLFFEPTGEKYTVTRATRRRYRQLCEEYGDSSQSEQISPAFRSVIARDKIKDLKDDDLVYFRKNGNTVTDIVPVRISRKIAHKPIRKLLGNIRFWPCTSTCLDECDVCDEACHDNRPLQPRHPDSLCPACSLFGTSYYAGRVQFGFAWHEGAFENETFHEGRINWFVQDAEGGAGGGLLTLPLAEKPRLGWSMPPADPGDDDPQEVPGRKFYVHHPSSVDKLNPESGGTAEPKTKNNRTIEPLGPGNRFRFEVNFDNLSAAELGQLVYSIELAEGLAHKIGRGKLFGLGSVDLTVESILCRNPERDGELSMDLSSQKVDLVTHGISTGQLIETGHLENLYKLLWVPKGDVVPVVRYPRLNGDSPAPCITDGARDVFYEDLKKEKGNNGKWTPLERRQFLQSPWTPWYP